jgi:hypothetical protein
MLSIPTVAKDTEIRGNVIYTAGLVILLYVKLKLSH